MVVVSDLDCIEFNCESPQLDMDTVFRPGIDTPLFPTALYYVLRGSADKPINLDEEEDRKLNSYSSSVLRTAELSTLLRDIPFDIKLNMSQNLPIGLCLKE